MSAVAAVPLARVVDLLPDAVCLVDDDGRFLFVSAAFEEIVGYRPDEVIGRPMIGFVFPEDRPKTIAAVDAIAAGRVERDFENRYVRKDGRIVDIAWSARSAPEHGVHVAVGRDVTARKRDQAMQAALYALSETANRVEAVPAWLAEVHRIVADLLPLTKLSIVLRDDANAPVRFVYESGPGTDADAESAARTPDRAARLALGLAVIARGGVVRAERDGEYAALFDDGPDDAARSWTGVPLTGPDGCIGALLVALRGGIDDAAAADDLLRFVATQVTAVVERKRSERRLRHAVGHDPLTDLPNRKLVHDRIMIALARGRRDGTRLSLLYLDIDGFKDINDRLGHSAGDEVLQEVARRLRGSVRESDTVGRVGGDEFVVLFDGMQSVDQAPHLAEALRIAIAAPFEVAGRSLTTSISVGIANYPEHGLDLAQLIASADAAMYRAKKAGGNRSDVAVGAGA